MEDLIYIGLAAVVMISVGYVLHNRYRKQVTKPVVYPVSPAPDFAAIQAAVEANRGVTYPVSSAPTPAAVQTEAEPVVAVVPRRKKAAGASKTAKKV
jgi:hypothetical protein